MCPPAKCHWAGLDCQRGESVSTVIKVLIGWCCLSAAQRLQAQDQGGRYWAIGCPSGPAGKILQFYRASDTTATGLVATDTTDANGRWDVNLPGTGNYRIYSVSDVLWLDRFSWLENYGYGVDVRYYGAKGDGVTDDGAAIQMAVDSSTRAVYFPYGTY